MMIMKSSTNSQLSRNYKMKRRLFSETLADFNSRKNEQTTFEKKNKVIIMHRKKESEKRYGVMHLDLDLCCKDGLTNSRRRRRKKK